MATKTTNYEFTKPNDDDYYDIQIENRNWDRADQQLKKLEEEKADVDGGDISETKIKTFDQPTEEFPVPAAGDSVKGVVGKVKKFFEDFKAFKNGVITVGRLVNNGLTTKEGFALDARYGKTLADAVAQLNSEILISQKSVSAVYLQDTNICSLMLKAGHTYLVLGSANIDISRSDSIMSVSIVIKKGNVESFGPNTIRTVSHSGGGAIIYRIITCHTDAEIYTAGYGYFDADYNYIGSLLAIQLNTK